MTTTTVTIPRTITKNIIIAITITITIPIATTTNINAFEKQLKSAAKDQTLLVRNFNNLNKLLTRC